MNQIAPLFADSLANLVTPFTGNILDANDKADQWFGYERSEMTGRTLHASLPEKRTS